MARHLALLRGINVGGNNIIVKDDLRACFEDLGFESVLTYIQSGNILFRAAHEPIATMTARIEAQLSTRFDYDAQAVVLTERKYRVALEAAPEGWGTDESKKHHAMFPLGHRPQQVLAEAPEPHRGIDEVTTGPGVIFWSVSKEHVTKSALMKLASSPAYKKVTVRNHKTTLKLLELFERI